MMIARQLRWWGWPIAVGIAGVLVWWVVWRGKGTGRAEPVRVSGTQPAVARAQGEPDSLMALLTKMSAARAARESKMRRQLDEAVKLGAAGRVQEGLDLVSRMVAAAEADVEEFRGQIALAETRPSSSSVLDLGRLVSDGRVPQEMMLARLDRRAVELASLDVKLGAKEIAEQQWANSYGAALDSEPESAGLVLERVMVMQGERMTAGRLWQLLGADLPPMARALVVQQLWAYHAPVAAATVEDCSRFFEGLIARSVDVPAVAEGLLERYVQELDSRGATEVANRVLEGMIAIVPETRLGARAAGLRVAGETGVARDRLVLSLRETYGGTEVGKALQGLHVEILARENRFIEAFQALDSDGGMGKATTPQELMRVLAGLALRVPSSGAWVDSQRRGALAGMGKGESGFTPAQMCMGLAEELTGRQVSPGDWEPGGGPTTNRGGPMEPVAMLADLLEQATKSLSAESVRQTMLAGMKAAGSSDRVAAAGPKTAPQRLFEVTWQANFLNATGRPGEAIGLYRRFLEEYRDDEGIRMQARVQFVELLMRQAPMDVAELERQLERICGGGSPVTGVIWNLRLRVLLQRIMLASADKRAAMWAAGLGELGGEAFGLSEATLADLDQLPSRVGVKGAFTPLNVLNDLLLLAPSVETMHHLQARRIALLLSQGRAEDVDKAIGMDVALASVTAEGFAGVADRCRQIVKLSGIDEGGLEGLEAAYRSRMVNDAGGSPGIDASLREAAGVALKRADSGMSLRRRALVKLLAGDMEEGLRSAHAMLNGTPASEEALDAMDYVGMLLAIADGSFRGSNRFAQWLAEGGGKGSGATTLPAGVPDRLLAVLEKCEGEVSALIEVEDEVRSSGGAEKMPVFRPSQRFDRVSRGLRRELAKAALRRWGQRAVGWGASLLENGDAEGARAIWSFAVNAQRHRGYSSSLMDQIVQRALAGSDGGDSEGRLRLLEEMMPMFRLAEDRTGMRVRVIAVRRQSGLKVAKGVFDEGEYAGCLALLDELDKRCPEVEGAGDMATGFMRALCLIRLERMADAAALLGKMESWPGSPEQHARALFLTGWICLQRDEKAKAIGVFRRVAEGYPQTSFAAKAVKLVAGME